MSKVNDGGPAFPTLEEHGFNRGEPGMTLRQYAAIKLRVPNSGTDWLDEMIRASLRDEFAAKAMAALIPESFSQDDEYRPDVIADRAYWFADAMLAAREDS